MASPTRFPEANAVLEAPGCEPLPVCVTSSSGLAPPVLLTRWQPSLEDLERLVLGAPIWIQIVGSSHPPICVTTEDPFIRG